MSRHLKVPEDEAVLPGARLRQARESLKLTPEDIAGRLHVSVKIITALERDEFDSLAAPVYVAGYLRAYARAVNLSAEEILAGLDLDSMSDTIVESLASPATTSHGQMKEGLRADLSLAPSRHWKRLALWAALVVVVVVAGLAILLGDDDEAGEKKVASPAPGAPSAQTALPLPVDSAQSGNGGGSESQPTLSRDEMAAPIDHMAQDDLAVGGVTQGAEVTLVLQFHEDSWAEVVDSRDERLLYRLGRGGQTATVTGVPPFDIRLGYLPGVTVYYNGEPWDLSRFQGRRSVSFSVNGT